jgi:hypothetical protein
MALRPPSPQPLQVWSKSGSNEGHFTLQAKTVFCLSLASQSSEVTQTSHVAHPPHAVQQLQVLYNLSSNEGRSTLEAERVFCPCRTAVQRGNSTITLGTPFTCAKPVQVSSKPYSKKGHFTLRGETVFRPCLA